MKTLWFSAVYLFGLCALQAAPEALLVPPGESARAGTAVQLTLFLNNPTTESADFIIPEVMQATLVSAREQRSVRIVPVGLADRNPLVLGPMSFRRVTVSLMMPDTIDGNVSVRITDPETNAIMFSVAPAAVVSSSKGAIRRAELAAVAPEDLDLTSEQEKVRGHISGYDPIYLAVGFRDKTTAKFQFSFKYRLFGPSGNVPEWWRELYFGYTQTSLWDLSDTSRPFYDTSYKPAVFYWKEALEMKPEWLTKLGLQAGVQHESNGSSGDVSRSLNTVFVTPYFTRSLTRKWSLTVAPRFLAYLEKSENPRIQEYRGYVDLMIRLGASQGVEFTSYVRKGSDSRYGSAQFDLTWPLRKIPGVASTVGGNLLLQYFNGWGESLRDYNIRRPDQLRAGFMLVR